MLLIIIEQRMFIYLDTITEDKEVFSNFINELNTILEHYYYMDIDTRPLTIDAFRNDFHRSDALLYTESTKILWLHHEMFEEKDKRMLNVFIELLARYFIRYCLRDDVDISDFMIEQLREEASGDMSYKPNEVIDSFIAIDEKMLKHNTPILNFYIQNIDKNYEKWKDLINDYNKYAH